LYEISFYLDSRKTSNSTENPDLLAYFASEHFMNLSPNPPDQRASQPIFYANHGKTEYSEKNPFNRRHRHSWSDKSQLGNNVKIYLDSR
jgi:hypothetical protein